MRKISKPLRASMTLILLSVLVMMLVTPHLLSNASAKNQKAYTSVKNDPSIYEQSESLIKQALEAHYFGYIDLLDKNLEPHANQDIAKALYSNSDILKDQEVVDLVNSFASLKVANPVYRYGSYYIKQTVNGKDIAYGDEKISYMFKENFMNKNTDYENNWYLAFSLDSQGGFHLINTNVDTTASDLESRYQESLTAFESAIKEMIGKSLTLKPIKDISFVVVINKELLGKKIVVDDVDPWQYVASIQSYLSDEFILFFGIISIVLCSLTFMLPIKILKESRVLSGCLRKISLLICLVLVVFDFIIIVSLIPDVLDSMTMPKVLVYILLLFLFMTTEFLFILHIKKIITFRRKAKEKSSKLYHTMLYISDGFYKAFRYIKTIDITSKNEIRLLVLSLINTFLIFVISLTFIENTYQRSVPFVDVITFTIFLLPYSIVIFLILHHFAKKLNKDYQVLNNVIIQTVQGGAAGEIPENLGIFAPMKASLQHLQDDFQNAVEQEVQSQKMKTELITNVSHDLKTPLTSIISYIDLLGSEELLEEDRKKYLEILDHNADRLKHLIENLFEISKANSGNICIDLMEIDIISLVKQVEMECDSLFIKKDLTIRNQFDENKIILTLDSQKTYRIFENLIGNVGKYALEHTRVYVKVQDYGNMVEIAIKNISATELDFDPDEIMERFARGDKSRNSEGSGLGLAIAKTFTEIQKGMIKIMVDGDLFKVVIRFYRSEEQTS